MKTVITKYHCDNCNEEMSQLDHEEAVKVSIIVNLPNPKGGCGQQSGTTMELCKKCSAEVGIVNSNEYHGYMNSQGRLTDTIEKYKQKLLGLFSKKKNEKEEA